MPGRQPLSTLRPNDPWGVAPKGSAEDWTARTTSFLQVQMPGRFEQRHLDPLTPLFGHPVDFTRPKIAREQDIAVAMQAFQASLVKMGPTGPVGRDFVAAPRDLMLYEKKDGGVGLKEAEFNGSGYGGRTNADPFSQAVLWASTTEAVTKHFKPGDTPVIAVSVSGMEDAEDPKPNTIVHEHMTNALVIAKGLESKLKAEVRTCTLDDITSGKIDLNDHKPTVVFDYTTRFLETMQVSGQRITLGGRAVNGVVDDPAHGRDVPVDGVFNDRLTGCLKVKHGGDLQFLSFNSTDAIGQSKSNSHAMFNAFTRLHGAQYSLLSDPIHYKDVDVRGQYDSKKGKQAVLKVVKELLAEGRNCILKPSNAGNGKGITFVDIKPDGTRPSDKEIMGLIDNMWAEVNKYYRDANGKYSAGETITVEETLKLATVHNAHDPQDPQNGKTFDFRAPVVQAKGDILLQQLAKPEFSQHLQPGFKERIEPDAYYLFSIPTAAKVNAGVTRVNNLTASTVSAAPNGARNLLALQNADNLAKIGLTVADNIQIAQWNTAQAKFAIEQLDAHGGNVPPQDAAGTSRQSGWSAGRLIRSMTRTVRRSFASSTSQASARHVVASPPQTATVVQSTVPGTSARPAFPVGMRNVPDQQSPASPARPATGDPALGQAIDAALAQALGPALGQSLSRAFSEAVQQAGEQVKDQVLSLVTNRMQALDADLQRLAGQLQNTVDQWSRGLQPGGGAPAM